MRGASAKRLRRNIYGDDYSPKERTFATVIKEKHGRSVDTGAIFETGRRGSYQRLKKVYTRGVR